MKLTFSDLLLQGVGVLSFEDKVIGLFIRTIGCLLDVMIDFQFGY